MNRETIFDNWGRSYSLEGLYSDFPNFFRLIHYPADGSAAVTREIGEPPGWSSLRLTLERSKEWHGVSYEYSSTDDACEFNEYSGRDFIKGIFNRENEDATILLEYGLRTPDFDVVEWQGRLNLGTYSEPERRVACALERSSLHSLVDAKWDRDVSVLSAVALNGKRIDPPDLVDIPLSAQSLDERFVCNVAGGARVNQTFTGDTNGHIWLQFDTSKPNISEIEEFAGGKQTGISDSEGPVANESSLLKLRSAGTRKVEFEFAYTVWLNIKKKTVSFGAAYITGYTIGTYIVVVKANGTKKEYQVGTPVKMGTRGGPGFRQTEAVIQYQGKISTSIDLDATDRFYVFGLLSFDHNKNDLQQTQVGFQVITQRMSISGRSRNQASSSKGFALIDALNATLTVITGLPDRLRSTFYGLAGKRYGSDGCGARRIVTNGFAIRQFKPTERPLNWSLRDALQSLQSIDCIGMEYGTELQPDGTYSEIMRVEPIGYFYRPVELLRLDKVENFKPRTITDQVVSTLSVGYNDFVSEGAGALEEIFTTHQVQTPVKNEQGTKTFVSKLIASSLAIERTRRSQFDTTQKDGTTYDEKAFLIQCKPIPAFRGRAEFTNGSLGQGVVLLDEPISWLAPGTKVAITGTVYNGGTYDVTFVSDQNRRPWSFYVAQEFQNEVAENAVLQSSGGLDLQPETADDFEQIIGLASGDTYNLRLTPGRMLLNTVALWAGALIGKLSAVTILQASNYPYQGTITVRRGPLFIPISTIELSEPLQWIGAGSEIVIDGPSANKGTFRVIGTSDETLTPWKITVVGLLTAETVGSITISVPDVEPTGDLVTKTRQPGNAKITTVLPAGDSCGKSGTVRENAPIEIDELLPDLLFRPRELTFSARVSWQQLQRLRLGSRGLLPIVVEPDGSRVDVNYGYVSLIDSAGLRVAGYLQNCDWSPLDEKANFTLIQTALDLNDTTSGLDCSEFIGWTLEQLETADAKTRRRAELCRWVDVDEPL